MYSNILQYFKNHFLLLFSSLETWLIDSGVVWCWIIRNLENLGFSPSYTTKWLPWWLISKESACQCRRQGFDPWVGKISWRRKQQPTPIFLPGKSHGQRSLVGYRTWGCKRAGHNLVTNQQQHIQRKMHRVYEDFGNEKSLAHIKETSRCIFTIVKLFPKLFMRLKHSKDYFLNVSVLENVKRAKHVSCVSNQLSLSDSF